MCEVSEVNHREYYALYMDFDSLRDAKIFPSDIDMIYKCRDNYIIIGEIKYKGNRVKGMQEVVLTNLIDEHESGGCLMEIEHMTRVQDKDTVDVADCKVTRAYFDGKWHEYPRPLSVLKWMTNLNTKHGGISR